LLAKQWRIPAFLIRDWVLARQGDRLNDPGRLYSFRARKKRS
jgi:hypothetical protein